MQLLYFTGAQCGQLANSSSPTSCYGIDQQPNRLALAGLDRLLQLYSKQALTPATTQPYEVAKKCYLAFCQSAYHQYQPQKQFSCAL